MTVVLGLALCAPVRAQGPREEASTAVELLDALGATDVFDAGSPAAHGVLLELLRMPRAELFAAFDEIAREPTSEATRTGALRALGELGGAQEVRLLGRLTVVPDASASEPGLRAPYADALGALLRRHPEALWNVADAYEGAPAGIGARIVEAVVAAPSDVRADVLARMLGARAEIDCQVLAGLERVAREERSVGEAVARRVRAQLSARDARTRQSAALVAGALGDAQAVEELIELCAEPGGFPRSGAQQALREITGLTHGSAAAWRSWYEREETWWRRTAPDLLSGLAHGTPERTAEALLDLSRRRLHRDEIARAVAVCLRRGEPDLVVLACAVLQSLASESVREDLALALERPEPSVRAAARAALSALGGPSPVAAEHGRGDG